MALNLLSPILASGTGTASAVAARMRRYEAVRFEASVERTPNRIEAAGKVILSAEQHTDTGDMLVILLRMAGYEVRSMCNIEDAMESASVEVFDLYLIGDLLPYGRNLDLVKQIRKSNSYTPLILHSARALMSDIRRGLLAGAQDYLVKPCDPDHLVNTIRRHINRRAMQWV